MPRAPPARSRPTGPFHRDLRPAFALRGKRSRRPAGANHVCRGSRLEITVSSMSDMLPLFPLSTVLFPGMRLPLHIFEERYRQLVADLLTGPEPRQFGIIAIRKGRETGIEGATALYDIGCVATVRQIAEREDGRYDLQTVGVQRFRLLSLDSSLPYFQGEIEP